MTCGVYIRKSREEEGRAGHRLQAQREQLPAHAAAQGWHVELYDDGYASAARGKQLPQRDRLEADLRAGRIHVILVLELSRLSRDDTLQDYVRWLAVCSEHGVKLATPSRLLDPREHSDWMMLLLEGGFSSVEMKTVLKRMGEGRARAHEAGAFLGGRPPRPYRLENGRLVLDRDEAGRVRRVLELAQGASAEAISRRTGLPYNAVRRILSDERLDWYLARRKSRERPGEWVDCQWPALLDAETADRIRQARKLRVLRGGKSTAPVALLTGLGLLRCGYCGRTVKTWSNHRKRADGSQLHYYGCDDKGRRGACPRSRLVPRPVLEERITHHLLRTLQLADLPRYYRPPDSGEAEQITRRLAILDEQKARLVDAIAEGVLPIADAKPKLGAIAAERSDLEATLSALDQPTPPPDFAALAGVAAAWQELTRDEQRELLGLAFERVAVFGTFAWLTYRFPCHENGEPTARIHLPPSQQGRRWKQKSPAE